MIGKSRQTLNFADNNNIGLNIMLKTLEIFTPDNYSYVKPFLQKYFKAVEEHPDNSDRAQDEFKCAVNFLEGAEKELSGQEKSVTDLHEKLFLFLLARKGYRNSFLKKSYPWLF